MARKPLFWAVFAALGVGGALTAVRLFSVALPTVSVDITMNRERALARAGELAAERGWGGADDRSAASFGSVDPEVQTYVELEGGGREAFAGLPARGLYEPYQWRVRRFAERRVEEVTVSFTPDGRPYGFNLELGEDDPGGGNLDTPSARALAEVTAGEWDVDVGAYRLLDSSQETLPGGRVDHRFVYERSDVAIGDGRFRLRIGIAGSRAAELTHSVFVPQAFSRRYADMRSTNDAIALAAQAVFTLLFVLLGAGAGSALLLRRRWIEWRVPLAWGAVIALLFGLNTVNQMPLSWMSYDTALSASDFALQQMGAAVAIALLGAPVVAFFLLAGESLGRRAFGHHVQQWRFWSPAVASSTTAAGMTTAAYLLVGLQLGYVVLFYLGTQSLDGWWAPAEALVQPDLLATYLPWLQAVSLALFASFWEESAFRAVPIACAALLGARYGRRSLWIWSAVLLQAVVFAASHANYPQQPPYARVVELTGPALLWGIVYVRYGLVPTLLAHFLYDLSLISVVLFESRAPLDQAVIVAVALVPLGVVLAARARAGGRDHPPEWAFNRAWSHAAGLAAPSGSGIEPPSASPAEPAEGPPAGAGPAPDVASGRPMATTPVLRAEGWRLPAWAVPAAGAVGVLLWVGARLIAPPPPRLWGDAAAAVEAARAELGARGAVLDGWSALVTASGGPSEGRAYAFEEAGLEAYTELAGTYFDTPRWVVRFVDWGADPEARVEEYRVWVGDEGRVTRLWHNVPEARPAASLSADAAREIAVAAATTTLDLDRGRLSEVEAREASLPARTDWTFTFTELGLLEAVDGEARVEVHLAGDEVVDVARSVRVPEEWTRARREMESRRLVAAGGLLLLLGAGFGAASIGGVVSWSRGRLVPGIAVRLALPVVAAIALAEANAWPGTVTAFSTAQPLGLQAGSVVVALLLAAMVAAPAIGFAGALALTWLRDPYRVPVRPGTSVALGLLAAGLLAMGGATLPAPPSLPDYSGAAAFVPFLDASFRAVTPFLLITSSLLVVLAVRDKGRGRHYVQSALATVLVVAAVVAVPAPLQEPLPVWGLAALVIAIGLFVGLRLLSADPALVPGVVGTVTAVDFLTFAHEAPHVGARAGGVLAAVTAVALAWAVTRLAKREAVPADASPQSVEGTRASVGSV